MQFGIQMVFQNFDRANSGVTDAQVYDEEIRLGILAEKLGFDALWPVEHHFEDYSFCPDNTQFLSYMAARTDRIKLGTGAVILPWNVPVRIAEKVVPLDHLCQAPDTLRDGARPGSQGICRHGREHGRSAPTLR